LSFLDYLRELIVKANRQLFFATANDDLAFLFKKKFEFLGEKELKVIPLSRSDD
jgi:exonuclease SbcC